jgi:Protein of unknown function (DUF2877)
MPAPRSIARPVAASTLTRQLIAGPRRLGRVLGVFPSAVYVEFATEAASELVAVETADGLRLPRAATLAAPSSTAPLRSVRAGDDAHVGEGGLEVGPLTFDVVRWWSPRRPRPVSTPAYDATRLNAVSLLLPPLPPELEERLGSLTRALAAGERTDVQDATTALLGLGVGLTPQGDDVLAGLLVTLVAAPVTLPLASRLGDAVNRAASRTTTLSAALLRDAAGGFAVPAVVDLVDVLHEADHAGAATTHGPLADVVVRLLAVGHTSGAALAQGALAAARLNAGVLVDRSAHRPLLVSDVSRSLDRWWGGGPPPVQ